jgi:uncharacterized surface protein with fasciclin (FAS1) repeats
LHGFEEMQSGDASPAPVEGNVDGSASPIKTPGMTVYRCHAGNTPNVTIAYVNQSNGVIHVIDSVLLP